VISKDLIPACDCQDTGPYASISYSELHFVPLLQNENSGIKALSSCVIFLTQLLFCGLFHEALSIETFHHRIMRMVDGLERIWEKAAVA
jgi:hypothetical protein